MSHQLLQVTDVICGEQTCVHRRLMLIGLIQLIVYITQSHTVTELALRLGLVRSSPSLAAGIGVGAHVEIIGRFRQGC